MRSGSALRLFLLLSLLAAGLVACKLPLDERQAVTELKGKTALLEEELQRLSTNNGELRQELDDLKLRYAEVRDELLKQAEELKMMRRLDSGAVSRSQDSTPSSTAAVDRKKKEPTEALAAESEVQPDELMYRRSMAAYKDGDYEEAVRLFASALQQYPKSVKAANARYWLGESYYSLAQYAQAIAEFSRVQKDYPESSKVPDASLKIAMSYEAIGSFAAARRSYAELLEKFPGGATAARAREALARLNST